MLAAAIGVAVTILQNADDDLPPPACTRGGTSPAIVQPTPDQAAGLTFCPVEINGGRLPITGKFRLQGQVLGPIDARQRMVLVVASDPNTCDALGNPAPDARMLIRDALIGSPDGSWSYIDGLGYDEAVTYARNFEYVLASSNDVLNEIRNDRDHYLANGGDPDAYAGMTDMPDGAIVVARFDVPAGLYRGSPGVCRD